MEYKKLTKEDIIEAVKNVKLDLDKKGDRTINAYRGCLEYGMVNLTSCCGNPECVSCNEVKKAFKEEMMEHVLKPFENKDMHNLVGYGKDKKLDNGFSIEEFKKYFGTNKINLPKKKGTYEFWAEDVNGKKFHDYVICKSNRVSKIKRAILDKLGVVEEQLVALHYNS